MRHFFGKFSVSAFMLFLSDLSVSYLHAAPATAEGQTNMMQKGMTLWDLLVAGGWVMIPLALISIAATASAIYHFRNVTPEKMTPVDVTENILSLTESKQYDKAIAVCKQQPNMISSIALKGLERVGKGKMVVEEAIQYEGKAQTEKLWQNLSYFGDMAVIAPMLGLLGTILGMIDAFNYQAFKAGIIKPIALAQGLAKAMITTAFGLIIAVPILMLYAYFRGRVGTIASNAERASGEIAQTLNK